MRVTGNRLIDLAAASNTQNQSAVATVSEQLSSGLRVVNPSDDPTAWLSAQRLKLSQALSQGADAAQASSKDALQMTDGALQSIGSIVSQVRALAVQGASDSNNADARANLGTQVQALFGAAIQAANTKGPDGEFLLAGTNSLTQPFADATGAYQGNATTRAAPTTGASATSAVTVAGSSLTAANGVDILPLLGKVATALSNNDMPTLLSTLPDLDTAITQVSHARGEAGAALDQIQTSSSARSALETNMTAAISRYVEVDVTSAASDLAKASTALQASQAVAAHVISLLKPST
jgi:flagellar hook-associated protein 3 FlgL